MTDPAGARPDASGSFPPPAGPPASAPPVPSASAAMNPSVPPTAGAPTGPAGPARPAPEQQPSAGAGRASNRSLGIGALVLGAVISALASAIINPGMFASAWRLVSGAAAPSTISTPSPSATVLVTKTNPRKSVTVRVPASWAIGASRHNPFEVDTPGDAVAVGTNPFVQPSPATTRLYIAASRDSLRRLKVSAADLEPLTTRLEVYDWSQDGCVLTSAGTFPGTNLVGPMREWADCNGLADSTMWEAWTITPNGKALVYLQLTARTADADRSTAEQILASVVVDTAKLSG